MKILVTGSQGQVGHCLSQQLSAKEWTVKTLAREQLDISDSTAVDKMVKEFAPDIIINAAAYTAVDKAETDAEAAFRINRDGPQNLAKAAHAINAVILHISTDYVFAGDASEAYQESAETAPQGVYGKSKLEGEVAVAQANPKHIILRTAWVFCEHGNNFVKTMIRLGAQRDALGIVADQVGGPTYAQDIAAALIKIAEQYNQQKDIPWGIYHFSGAPHVSWYEFARYIFNEVKRADLYEKPIPDIKPIATADYPTPAKRPANSRLDCTKIHDAFGINPSDWRVALKNIQDYAS